VLPARHRMRRRADFTTAIQRGRRGATRDLVVHVATQEPAEHALVGFVVSRGVGGAVVRNRVKRRMRALMADRLDGLPPGARVVVRALPPAAEADVAALARDLDRALRRATRARGQR
jgi:ribonuclease P protein component